MYTVLLPLLPVSPMPDTLLPPSSCTAWSTLWMMLGTVEKSVYASTSFSACETDSAPNGQRIFFKAYSSEVDVSWTR